MDDITLRLIQELNPWRRGQQFTAKPFKREIFSQLEQQLKRKQILALYGLRQVGKSTLMKQIIEQLLAQGVKSTNIIYFNFEDRKADNELIDEIIKEAERGAEKGKIYVLLDEIQKIPYWQDILKRHYDMEKGIKFIISGSASIQIKKSKESLAGRILDFHVPVLGFREFLQLAGSKVEARAMELFSPGLDWEKEYRTCLSLREKAGAALIPYLYSGAFPELVGNNDEEFIKGYIKSSIIDKIVYTDIPETFNVKNRELLMAILEYASKETAQLFEISSLANALNVNRATISEYVHYLELSFLLGIQPNFTKSTIKQMRTLKKLHLAHPCIATAIRRHTKSEMALDELCGKYVETVIFQCLHSRYEHVNFYRNANNGEVDVVLRQNEKVIPIEVKFQNRIGPDDFDGLKAFFGEKKVRFGLLVTKDRFELVDLKGAGKVQLVPLWLFLLCI